MFNLKPLIITGLAVVALSTVVTATSSLAKTPVKVTYASQNTNTAQTIASGTFSGRSDHVTTGDVSIIKTADAYQLTFAENFVLDGALDPIVGFGNNGKFDKKSKLDALSNKTGAQSYQLPADFNPAQFTEVYVFCEKFSVPLGVATLNYTQIP